MTTLLQPARSAKPRDCQIICTLPGTLEEFRRDVEVGPPERLAPCHMQRIARHHRQLSVGEAWSWLERGDLRRLEAGLEHVAALGASVERSVRFDDFLPDPERRAVVIIAHSYTDRVEFRDGLHAAQDVAARFDSQFDGAIDLSMCSSFTLHDELRHRCAAAPRIITNSGTASPGPRISLVALALELMHRVDIAYHDAVAAVLSMKLDQLLAAKAVKL